jgi:hypothetical protein
LAVFFAFQRSVCRSRGGNLPDAMAATAEGDVPRKTEYRPTTRHPSTSCSRDVGSEVNSVRIPDADAVRATTGD